MQKLLVVLVVFASMTWLDAGFGCGPNDPGPPPDDSGERSDANP